MAQLLRRLSIVFVTGGLLGAGLFADAQDAPQHRGRKYKAPPETSHIEVIVTKSANGKPVTSAAVIFRATRAGKDDGNLEVKTDPDGKAVIDVIQTGSKVQVQVFATGYATFAESYQVDEATREIHVALQRPREQVSAYADNSGKASTRKAGVQEPEQQRAAPSSTTLQPRPGSQPAAGATPGSTAPTATDPTLPAASAPAPQTPPQ